MDETLFQKEYLPKIRQVLDSVLSSPHSDFYRKKYKDMGIEPSSINTYEDFQKIPFLTKDEILSADLESRIFVPKDKITHYAFSSGTTNQNKVLIMPHVRPKKEVPETKYVFDEDKLRKMGVKNFLILLPILTGAATMVRKTPKNYIVDTFGDTSNLRKTALIAEGIGTDSVVSTATILYFFIEELTKVHFDFSKIKWIWLLGEPCSSEKYELLKSTFPNAIFNFTYGAAESTSGLTIRGYRCEYLKNDNTPIYHTMPIFLFETADEDGNIEIGANPGELIQTDLLTNKAFPLIRYKTGDIAIQTEVSCKCGNPNLIELYGRGMHDVFKFYGVTLYAHLINESLADFSNKLKPFFQMHIYEKKRGNKIVPSLVLNLSLRDGTPENTDLKKKIKDTVEEKLLLAMGKNLKYFVDKKLFLPLKVEFSKEKLSEKEQKVKHLVSHLN